MSEFVKWSISTILTYRVCPRKFYLAHILADARAKDPLRRQAHWLKKTINLEMWAGVLVDKAINAWVIPKLAQKQVPDFTQVEELAIDMARRQFAFSKQHRYRTESESKAGDNFLILDIHELGAAYEKADLELVSHRVRQAIRNLPTLTLPNGQLLLDFLLAADWLLANVQDRHIVIGKANINPQIDLLVGYPSRQIVFDWKVSDSKTANYERQLLVIGTLIYRKRKQEGGWAYQFSDIQLLEANLLNGHVKEHVLGEDTYQQTVDYITLTATDVDLMRASRKPNQIPIDEFAFTESDYACNTCPFYSLCNYLYQQPDEFNPAHYAEFVSLAQSVSH